MGAKPVSPQNGKFTIHGKNNNNLELTLDSTELDKYIVEELDGADMESKLPSENPLGIGWFICFSIYNKKDGKKNGYAKVKYSFNVTLAPGERFFVAYNNTAYEVTDEIKRSGKVTLSEGDPGGGTVPPKA
jgi:hypothetical protein